jgi:tRNA (guanine37-N1)-methyltransferase
MRFEIVTIFPGFFASIFEHGILRRALKERLVSIEAHDLRNFTHDRHRTVDDRPFGGGEGMVLKPEPLAEALEALGIGRKPAREQGSEGAAIPGGKARLASGAVSAAGLVQDGNSVGTKVILLSAQGRLFTQAVARELALLERVVLICGRYEGVDERINELYCDRELSIGDYVLSGGELAASIVIDATTRLLPGVLGNEASGEFESFGAADAEIEVDVEGVPRSQHGSGGLLDYPQYTRPAEFAGVRAPDVLLNGDHFEIRRWRRAQQLKKTLQNRPELLENAALSGEDWSILASLKGQTSSQ